jgi:hypothetical protein
MTGQSKAISMAYVVIQWCHVVKLFMRVAVQAWGSPCGDYCQNALSAGRESVLVITVGVLLRVTLREESRNKI